MVRKSIAWIEEEDERTSMISWEDTQRAWVRLCSDLWTKTYGKGLNDAQVIEQVVLRYNDAEGHHGEATPSEFAWTMGVLKWIDCGAPRLTTDAKYAAAMMSTKVGESLADDLVVPWKSFRIELPPGALDHDGYSYKAILVASFDVHGADAEPLAQLTLSGTRVIGDDGDWTAYEGTIKASGFGSLLFDREPDSEDVERIEGGDSFAPEFGDARARALRLAVRLVVGLLYTMQHTQHFKPAPPSLSDIRREIRSGPPRHRNIFVGRPLSYDARPAVRSYVDAEKRSAPSVQTLVRGHYKRQVVGVGKNGRKVIWVEPYWRGPEDAPIQVRPYKVGAG